MDKTKTSQVFMEKRKLIAFDIETTGIDPFEKKARITCIGVCENGSLKVFYHKQEKKLLEQFIEYVEENKTALWTGYNINLFDIPYIIYRCLKNKFNLKGKHLMTLHYGADKWTNPYKTDTAPIFQKNYKQFRKLQDVLEFLGLDMKTGTGAEAITLWEEKRIKELLSYVENDALVEYQLFIYCEKNGLIPNYEKKIIL
jgi:DNA polymerase elongation subunit (family B)